MSEREAQYRKAIPAYEKAQRRRWRRRSQYVSEQLAARRAARAQAQPSRRSEER